jgi:hypothetical protein
VLLAPAAAPALGPAGVIAVVAVICWALVADLVLRR